MNNDQIISQLNSTRPNILLTLGATISCFEDSRLEMTFDIDESLCHSKNIVQGGIVSAMLDSVMSHLLMADHGARINTPTIDMHTHFLRVSRAGRFHAVAYLEKKGRKIAFTRSELFDAEDRLTATATSSSTLIAD